MGAFETIVETMIQMDLLQLFFPWLLVTSLTYGAIKKYDVFEEDSVIGTVSISVGFISLAGIYIFAPENIFANFGAAIAFGVFGILGLVMMMAMAGVDVSELDEDLGDNPVAGIGVLIILASFVGVLVYQFDIIEMIGEINTSSSSLFMQIITLVFILMIVGIVTRGGD